MAMVDDFSPEQFALRWHNFSNNLSSGFSSHLNNKHLVDVTLAVEGKLLDAHKLVLSVCSPYFENIFKCNPCQHPVVILQDMKYSEVEALVKFMYQGEANVNQEDLARFLKVAEVLKVKGLTLDPATMQNLTERSDLPHNTNVSQMEGSCHNNNAISKEYSNAAIQHDNKPNNCINNLPIKSSKRIRKPSITSDNYNDKTSIPPNVSSNMNCERSSVIEKKTIGTNDNLSVEDLNKMDAVSHDESIDLTNDDDEFNDNSELFTAVEHNNSSEKSSNVELLTYRLSARGRPQLIYEGYVYNLTSRSVILNRSHYRCTEQHRGCRGKCAVISERFMPTGIDDHNHPPTDHTENNCKKKKKSSN